MAIRSRAPLRISFAGGGTDVSPFPETEGGAVLSATIDRYAYGSLTERSDDLIRIESVDLGVVEQLSRASMGDPETPLGLIRAAIQRFSENPEAENVRSGFDLVLHSIAPPGSGLGSSSTLLVTLVGLLQEFHSLPLTEYEIADMAHSIERFDLGIRGGLQDQYAATFGGFNYIEFGDRVVVNPLRIPDWIQHELEMCLLLCYTGKTRQSTKIIEDQTARLEAGDPETVDGLRSQKRLAEEMKRSLLRGQLREFGSLLGDAWREKQRMSPHIATPAISEAYDEACRAGALGGKVTGAGGGGYMLFYCDFPQRHRVAERLESMGMVPSAFAFDTRGLQTWVH